MRGRSQKTEVLSTPLESGALKGLNSGSLIEFDCGEPPSKEAATHKKDVTLIVMREAFEKLLLAGHGTLRHFSKEAVLESGTSRWSTGSKIRQLAFILRGGRGGRLLLLLLLLLLHGHAWRSDLMFVN